MRRRARVVLTAGLIGLPLAAFLSEKRSIIEGQEAVQPEPRGVSPYFAPKGYVCYRTETPIRIDGKLDDPAWNDAPWTDDFVDIEGDRQPRPRFRTRAKMRWDDEFFYVAAELLEPHVWGTLTAHDSVIFQDNDFEVFIDPNGDNHEYYEFEINALNTGWDLLLPRPYKDGGRAVNGWEIPGLKTAVAIDGSLNDPRDTDRGWTVELAFPWKSLGELAYLPAPPQENDQWRVNFSRVEWKHEIADGKYRKVPKSKEDNWVWSPQGVINMHRPESWGFVQFSTGKPGTVEFVADSAGPARHLLHEVYYAQQDFRKKIGRWAGTARELGFSTEKNGLDRLRISVTGEMFQATLPSTRSDGKQELWHIRQDSRVWKE
jgi:Carbohydrate family 9 binding domain-like